MRQVSAEQAQKAVENAFFQWGLPEGIRFDNGPPFGTTADRLLPSSLCLWLVSLGIEVIFNQPYSPWQNGSVECTQRISSRWANPSAQADAAQLQIALDQVAKEHLEVYRQRKNKDQTRLEQFPNLIVPLRSYDPESIDPQKVVDFLLQFNWTRKVYANGRIGLFSQTWKVGTKYKHQKVMVSLDPHLAAWNVTLPNGNIITSIVKMDLSKEAIKNLTIFSKNFTT